MKITHFAGKRIKNLKIETNQFNQRTITGQIELKQDVEMLNNHNDGLDFTDKRIQHPLFIVVKKGQIVNYKRQETRTGAFDTVFVAHFSSTKKVNEINYGE